MLKKLLLSLSLLLWGSFAYAQEGAQPTFTNSVARIVLPDGVASGFFTAPDMVVTARHVADIITRTGSRGAYVYDSQGKRHRVMQIVSSYDADMAVLQVDQPTPDQPVAETSCRVPAILETLLAAGHPAPYTNIFSPVMVVGYSDVRDGDDATSLVVAGAVAPGMSGGPLFDKEGKVVGIVSSAYNPSFTNIVLMKETELCTETEPAEEEAPAT
jgi:S1-C subfamily serine protease